MLDVDGGVAEYLSMLVVVVNGVGTGVVVGVVDVVGTVPRISAPGCFYGSHYHHIAVYPTPGRFLVSLYIGYHCYYLYTLSSGFSLSFPLWVYLHLLPFWAQH